MDYIWLIFYVAVSSFAVLGWLWRRWKTRGSPHWPMSEGTVESYRWERGRHHTIWFVVYSYSANGEYYSGEFVPQLSWTTAYFKSADKLEEIVKDGYPVGTKFPLRFRPDQPEWSVPFSREAMVNPLNIGS